MLNKELKFVKRGFVIEVDLHYKDYLVRANILKVGGKESNTYDVTLEIRRQDIDNWVRIDHQEHYYIQNDNVNMAVYELIMDKFAEGFFKRHIDRYEYEELCMGKGDDLFKLESFGE